MDTNSRQGAGVYLRGRSGHRLRLGAEAPPPRTRLRRVRRPADPGFGTHFDTDEVWVSLIEEGGDPADGKSRYARATRHAVREAFGDAYDRGWRPGEVVGLDRRRRSRRRRRVAWVPPQARLPHLEEGMAEPHALDGAVGDHAGVRHARSEHDGHRHVRVGCGLASDREDVDRRRTRDRRPRARDGPVGDPREHPGVQRPRRAHRRRSALRVRAGPSRRGAAGSSEARRRSR